MTTFIHQRDDWPNFIWDFATLANQLADVRNRQGLLIGKMAGLGFERSQSEALEALTEEVQKSSEIEGEMLERRKVRSSIARKLGLPDASATTEDRAVDGVVDMMIDATRNYAAPLTADRLYGWHAALFPTGYSGRHRILVGAWRDDRSGPMQVVSARLDNPRVHFEAPSADRLTKEMSVFIEWFESPEIFDPVLKAALAHLWFVTIHPFEDGNGRIARALADMALARAEKLDRRFYSMSAQIQKERSDYYDILERTQRGNLDITEWMKWFLGCLGRAIEVANIKADSVIRKARVWDALARIPLNARQIMMMNKLLDGFEGNLTTTKWATITKCSHDTAQRDIEDLIRKGALCKNDGAARKTSYSVVDSREPS